MNFLENIALLLPSDKPIVIPQALARTSAGFPSPAEDYIENRISLDEELIRHPNSTFLARNGVQADSMTGAGIMPKAMLVIDKSEHTNSGHIVVARIENEFTVKRLSIVNGKIFLLPENDIYDPIEVRTPDFEIWGRVIYSINIH